MLFIETLLTIAKMLEICAHQRGLATGIMCMDTISYCASI